MILWVCLILSACATDWKGAGYESEQQYELAAARKLSPYGAKLFFSYGIKTPKEYDVAVEEMKKSNYPVGNVLSDTLAEYLENKQKGSQEGLTPFEYRLKLIKIEEEAEALKASQISELERKIFEKKWAENQKQCELGNYTVFSKKLPGISYFALNNNYLKNYDGLKISQNTILPKTVKIIQTSMGIDLIRELTADPNSFASKISVEIVLQENGEINTTTNTEKIDLAELMKRKTYLDILRSPPKYDFQKKFQTYVMCN